MQDRLRQGRGLHARNTPHLSTATCYPARRLSSGYGRESPTQRRRLRTKHGSSGVSLGLAAVLGDQLPSHTRPRGERGRRCDTPHKWLTSLLDISTCRLWTHSRYDVSLVGRLATANPCWIPARGSQPWHLSNLELTRKPTHHRLEPCRPRAGVRRQSSIATSGRPLHQAEHVHET
jgi:hypothetical protein